MAIVDYEGFDRENANLNIFSTNQWSISADGQGYQSYGRYAFSTDGTMQRASAFASMAEGYWQAHIWFDFALNINGLNIRATSAGFEQVSVRFAPNSQKIEVWRGFNKLGESASTYPVGVWFFCQIRYVISTIGGAVEVWINGKSVLSISGNTANTGTPNWDGWQLAYVATPTCRIDNIVVYSTTGDPPTTRTPETRIWDTLPTGAGATTQWSPSAGANWQCVDEQPSNGDTDYVSAASSGLTDTYSTPAEAEAGSIIYAVAVHATMRKDDAGTNEVEGVIRSGGNNYVYGTPTGVNSSYGRHRWIWHSDPATGNQWTVAAANSAQPGIRRTS